MQNAARRSPDFLLKLSVAPLLDTRFSYLQSAAGATSEDRIPAERTGRLLRGMAWIDGRFPGDVKGGLRVA